MQENGTKLNTKEMTIEELKESVGSMDFDDLRKLSNEVRSLQAKIQWRQMVLKKAQHKYSS